MAEYIVDGYLLAGIEDSISNRGLISCKNCNNHYDALTQKGR